MIMIYDLTKSFVGAFIAATVIAIAQYTGEHIPDLLKLGIVWLTAHTTMKTM